MGFKNFDEIETYLEDNKKKSEKLIGKIRVADNNARDKSSSLTKKSQSRKSKGLNEVNFVSFN